MTILAALNEGEKTYIGCDTAAVHQQHGLEDIGPKWIVWEDSAVGVSGLLTGLCLLQQYMTEPDNVYDVVDQIKEILKDSEIELERARGWPVWDCWTLYATPQGIWEIGDAFTLRRTKPAELVLLGSGMDYAKGADHILESDSFPLRKPRRRVKQAVEIAIALDHACDGEVWTHELHV